MTRNEPTGDTSPAPMVRTARSSPDWLQSGQTVFRRGARSCLDDLMRNRPAALAGDAEGVHQMRVAIRRLRALLSAFAPAKLRRMAANELRWLIDVLGEARNLDVFVTDIVTPALADLRTVAELQELSRLAEHRRRLAHSAVGAAIDSTRFTSSVRALRRWCEEGEPIGVVDCEPLTRPIRQLVPALLDRRFRQVKKHGRHFSRQSEEDRHELRIALKKLRYSAELLADFYDDVAAERFVRRLKRLQDDLGCLNDVRVARDIILSLANSVTGPGIVRAGRDILVWHRRRLAQNERQLRRHLRQLLKTEPFWSLAT